jgi:hypothetical protein
MTQLDLIGVSPLGVDLPANLDCFTSPSYEGSAFKNIPIQFLKETQDRLRGTANVGYRIRYRFRGPRYDYTRGFTAKKDANRFSVYYVPNVESWTR